MQDYYVYLHIRLSGTPFYIGKGRAGRCQSKSNRNRHWENIVGKDGGFSTDFLTHGVDEELALLAEIEAIDVYRRRGIPLINMTNGGDGISGYKFTEEQRARLSAAHKGVKLSEAHRSNSTAARIGRQVSQETREKLSASNKGKKPTAFAIARSIETKKGKSHTAEHRANISAAQCGKQAPGRAIAMLKRWAAIRSGEIPANRKPDHLQGRVASPETRQRLSDSHKGKTLSASTRAKLSAITAAYWARKKVGA